MLSAGDRAPDAPLRSASGDHLRLFDLFRGPQWTVLAFGARHAPLAERLAATWPEAFRAHGVAAPDEACWCGGAIFADEEGHARSA